MSFKRGPTVLAFGHGLVTDSPAGSVSNAPSPAGVAVVMPVSARVPLESPVSSEVNEEEESPEADLDYLEDYDSEEERRLRKKKKVCVVGRREKLATLSLRGGK